MSIRLPKNYQLRRTLAISLGIPGTTTSESVENKELRFGGLFGLPYASIEKGQNETTS